MTCIRLIRWLSGQIASISQSGVQNLGIFLRCQILKSQPLFHFFISSTFIFWYWYNMYQGSQKYILQYLLTDEAYSNSRLFLLASELGASATRISRTLLMLLKMRVLSNDSRVYRLEVWCSIMHHNRFSLGE